MDEEPSEVADDGALTPIDELEERVLAVAEALREARAARRAAEAEVVELRETVQQRDMQIVLLKQQVGGDDLRTTVRTRVEALLRRLDELERDG